jgi:HK97 family phage major capsid protein
MVRTSAVTFTTGTALVRTIATWIPATRQILEDFGELYGFLMANLPFAVNREEELQILSGDNTGQNLNGLITQAQNFDTSLLVASAGWNRIDIIGRAIQQVQADNELRPSFIVMHPDDWWSIRLTKDSYGRYVLGDPQAPMANPNLFGLNVVVTTNITTGTFLIGVGSPVASEIRDRSGMTVEISTEHSTYFTENKVAIRAEKRLALVVFRPNSFVTGSFTTSPA